MRVLVVEDHSRLAEAVAGGLHEERMAVDVAYDGQDALRHVALTRYHVSVLDQELPSVHGDQICADLAGHRYPRPIALPSRAERHHGPPPSRVPLHP